MAMDKDTNIYELGDVFLSVNEYHGTFYAEAHRRGVPWHKCEYVRFYKSEENAVRKAESLFGRRAELVGCTSLFFASAFVEQYEAGLREGQWAVVVKNAHPDGTEDVERIICSGRDDAFDTYDSISIRGADYAAKKEVQCVEQTRHGELYARPMVWEEVNPSHVIL